MRPHRLPGLASVALIPILGCAVLRAPFQLLPGNPETTGEELHEAMSNWASSFEASVMAACDRIRSATKERDPRRNTLYWQIRMIPLARQAAFRDDPQEAYVASFALAAAQANYLSTGEGKTLFGAQQDIAIGVANDIEDGVVDIGRRFLTEKQLDKLEGQVNALITQHPIRGTFAVDALLEGYSQTRSAGLFSWVIDLPMVPFRALSGVSDTAQAVNAFNETAQEFTETVAALPHLTRWQLELLFYDAEELEAVDRALSAAEGVNQAADRISGVAETLPRELGDELSAQLERSRATIEQLDGLITRLQALTGPLEKISGQVSEASTQWTTVLGEFGKRDEGESQGRPFDIRDYEAAAVKIADASRQVRGLVDDLKSIDSGGSRAILDAATWRAGLLIVVFFAALALYRLTVSRLR